MLYTANGAIRNITEADTFKADLVWLKRRNAAVSHHLVDSVRGATKAIYSNTTGAEATDSAGVTGFVTDGFSLGAQGGYNDTGTFVSWTWKAAGSTSSNGNGNITSTVSANTTAGFSIVSWTGDNSGSATVGHGLGAVPNVVIIKKRDSATNWGVKHSSMTSGHMAVLNATDAPSDRNGSTNGGIGNLTSSTTFGFIGGGAGTPEVNNSSMIAYCFADVQGYSKFSSFVGNGNDDGTFVYTGFKPAFVMLKYIIAGTDWYINDTKRQTYNFNNLRLEANNNGSEVDGGDKMDMLSNGFKMRKTNAQFNASGGTHIYMAFAENPFVTSTGVPACAR
tara:strand:- start:191 stop:1195 length:1005 start_codon:yes stop_codon:yes gene_type:complete